MSASSRWGRHWGLGARLGLFCQRSFMRDSPVCQHVFVARGLVCGCTGMGSIPWHGQTVEYPNMGKQ